MIDFETNERCDDAMHPLCDGRDGDQPIKSESVEGHWSGVESIAAIILGSQVMNCNNLNLWFPKCKQLALRQLLIVALIPGWQCSLNSPRHTMYFLVHATSGTCNGCNGCLYVPRVQ